MCLWSCNQLMTHDNYTAVPNAQRQDQSKRVILDKRLCNKKKTGKVCESMDAVVHTRSAHVTLRSASHPAWLKQSMPGFAAPEDGPSHRKKRQKFTSQKNEPRWDGRAGIAAIISKVHSKMNVCGVTLPSELKWFRFCCRNFHYIAKVVACLSSLVGWLLQAQSSKTIREEHYQCQWLSVCVAELQKKGGSLTVDVKSFSILTSYFCEGASVILWHIAECFSTTCTSKAK